MKRVFKYQLSPLIEMPEGAQVLSVQSQFELPVLWALVDVDAPKVAREFLIAGTGHEIPAIPGIRFVGTIQLGNGSLVLHVWEK